MKALMSCGVFRLVAVGVHRLVLCFGRVKKTD